MSAREAILRQYSRLLSVEPLDADIHLIAPTTKLHYQVSSPCFKSFQGGNGNASTKWSFNGHHFTISSLKDEEEEDGNDNNNNNNGSSAFAACYSAAQAFVDDSSIDRPAELAHRLVYAMSYFYDRMKDIKVVREESALIKVRDYFLYAEHICDGMIRMRKHPFLCLDLTYIAAYLHDGLGLPLHKDILVSSFFSCEGRAFLKI